MTELKPLGAPKPLAAGNPKTDFVKNAGVARVVKPARRKAFTLEDDTTDYIKVMTFGVTGSGKTHLLGQLAEIGLKVAIITTDIGDTGHITIKNRMKELGRLDLLKNVVIIPLTGYSEVSSFIQNPWNTEIDEQGTTLEQFDPDMLAWDGFGSFQQLDLNEYVADLQPAKDKNRGDYRESGLILEQQDWNAIANATMRKCNDFLSIRKTDGRPVNKWVTCHEAVTQKAVDSSNPMKGTTFEEAYKPLLQGKGGQIILGGFDVILRTKVTTKKGDEGAVRIYTIVTAGSQNIVAKNRGFQLPAEMTADIKVLWPLLKDGPKKSLTEE